MVGDKGFEFAEKEAMLAEPEPGLAIRLQGSQAGRRQAGRERRKARVTRGKARAGRPPQSEAAREQSPAGFELIPFQTLLAGAGQGEEPKRVDPGGVDGKPVPGGAGADDRPAVGGEGSPERPHVGVQETTTALDRVFRPQPIDQVVGSDCPSRTFEQRGQHAALSASQTDMPSARSHFERAEQPKMKVRPASASRRVRALVAHRRSMVACAAQDPLNGPAVSSAPVTGNTGGWDLVDPAFGQWLRELREARRWTQAELARLVAYEVSTIRLIENARREPSKPFIVALARLLDVPVASLSPAALRMARRRPPPAPTTSMVGRTADVAAVSACLESRRIVSITGAPGSGKTRLGLAVLAHRSPLHGSVFLPLAGCRGSAEFVTGLRAALALPADPSRDPIDAIAEALAAVDLVVLADDFDHLADTSPLLTQLVAATSRLRFVVTSREALRLSGEAVYPLAPLGLVASARPRRTTEVQLSPAADLFFQRARDSRPSLQPDDASAAVVARICERLDGLPLAIELAAGCCGILSLEALLGAVSEGLDLPVPGRRDRPHHHRTLRAAIRWSYDLLLPTERSLLDRMGVFEGTFTAEAAVAVSPLEAPADPLATVGGLARRSLVQPVHDPDGPRFALLETIRLFALERLRDEHQLEAARRLHAGHYVDLARRAAPELTGPEQGLWLERLAAEHRNLAAAMDWLLANDPARALDLSAGVWRYWWGRSHAAAGRRWLEAALAQTDGERVPARVEAITGAAILMRTMGEVENGQALLNDALALAREIGDRDGEGLSLLNLAAGESMLGRHASAEAHLAASADAYLGRNLRGLAHVANGRGIVCVELGRLAEGRRHLEESLAMFERLADPGSYPIPLANLAWLATIEGDDRQALQHLDRAIALARHARDERTEAHALLNAGRSARRLGRTAVALGFFQDALLAFLRIGARPLIAEACEQLALIGESRGDAGTSIRLWAAAFRLRSVLHTPLAPADQRECDAGLKRARARAGEAASAAAWREGSALTLDEAVDLALGSARSGGGHKSQAGTRAS